MAVTPPIHFSAAARMPVTCAIPEAFSASAAATSVGSASGDNVTWLSASVVAVQLQRRPQPATPSGRFGCICSHVQLTETVSACVAATASSAMTCRGTTAADSCAQTGHRPASFKNCPSIHARQEVS